MEQGLRRVQPNGDEELYPAALHQGGRGQVKAQGCRCCWTQVVQCTVSGACWRAGGLVGWRAGALADGRADGLTGCQTGGTGRQEDSQQDECLAVHIYQGARVHGRSQRSVTQRSEQFVESLLCKANRHASACPCLLGSQPLVHGLTAATVLLVGHSGLGVHLRRCKAQTSAGGAYEMGCIVCETHGRRQGGTSPLGGASAECHGEERPATAVKGLEIKAGFPPLSTLSCPPPLK